MFTADKTDYGGEASSAELNTVCAAKWIFEETSEEMFGNLELVDFMTVLFRTPTFGMQTDVGRRIFELIRYIWEDGRGYDLNHGFDRETYYHARARSNDAAPYTADNMLRAPVGVTGPGRYNYPGRSHYYFSDTKTGAEAEVRKHNPDAIIQTIRLNPVREAQLLDLSETMRRGTIFLRFLRFDLEAVNEKMPREYLIPCFVSDCCKTVGFDGIKYYGGKGYSNYVTWEDGYFRMDGSVE